MYAFIRVDKFKVGDVFSVLREAQRTPDLHYKKGVDFDNDIDWTKTSQNVRVVTSSLGGVNKIMRDAGVKPRNKTSVGLVGAVIGATADYFTKDAKGNWLYDEKAQAFGEDVKKLVVEQLCGGDESRLASLVCHMDEGSIHWHALVVPIVDTPEGEKKLSAKALLNGRQRMRELQDRAFEILGKERGFDRGELVDLDKPAKSQKRHKTTGQFRDEEYIKAVDKIVEAALDIDVADVHLLDDLKDAAFGRGKLLPPEKYNKAVEVLRVIEALPKAVEGLKRLADRADKDGRIKTLQERLAVGHAKTEGWRQELTALRAEHEEHQAFGQLLRTLKATPDRSFADIWEQAKRSRTDGNGVVDYTQVVDAFIKLYQDAKRPRVQGHARMQNQDFNRNDYEVTHSGR